MCKRNTQLYELGVFLCPCYQGVGLGQRRDPYVLYFYSEKI
jgi:hypothetical protein